MNTTKNNSIVFGLKMLSILAFSLLVIPATASATLAFTPTPSENPAPMVNSISPDSKNRNDNVNTITITGSGFISNSVARVNGQVRPTVFIDASHLSLQLIGNDAYNPDGLYINVFNELPGGGYSNAAFFKTNMIVPATTNTGNTNGNTSNNNYGNANTNGNTNNTNSSASKNTKNSNTSTSTNNNQTKSSTTTDANSNYSNLASNAIFGTNGFMPTGLIQWILFAIIVLLLIILVRKIFGGKKNYDEAPMKHA
ncbi:MAG: hypothetical protein WC847_02245 [Candidatus Paceibacterota bacterium]|jgi:hypothetical protein